MKKILTVTLFTGMLTLLRMLMGFVIAKIVAIYTGPAGMAMLGQVQSLVAGLNGLVNAPAGTGVVRYTSENYQRGYVACSPWWRASVKWILLLLLLVVSISFMLKEFLSQWLFKNPSFNWLIMMVVVGLPLSTIGTLFTSVVNGQQQYRRFVWLGAVSTVVSSAVMVFLIVEYKSIGALIAVAIQYSIIGLVVLILSLNQPWFKLKYWWGITGRREKRAIGGYILMAVTTALCIPTSIVLVRNCVIESVGWEQAGHWQAVWRISEAYLSVITLALSTYFLPRLALLMKASEIVNEVNEVLKIVLPISIALAFIVYIFRDYAIIVLFTESFMAARDLFAIQLLGDVVKVAGWLFALPMLSRGVVRWYVFSEIFFSVLFVFLSFSLVRLWGVEGVNYAYLINYCVYFLFARWSVSKCF